LRNFLKKLKNLLLTRTEITIQIIDKNFTPHNPEPVIVEGLLVDDDILKKVTKRGGSQGINLKPSWLNLISRQKHVKPRLLISKERNEHYILLVKPKEEEEIPT